jgi:membrane AbrB-like protein
VQWLLLAVASAILVAILSWIQMPAAALIGPMLAAIAAGVAGATIRLPRPFFGASQAVIGCLIAASIQIDIFASFVDDWPIIAVAVLSTVAASSVLGWMIARLGVLPGTTGVWGSSPGAATAMVLMAGAFGADARLVAFMQYLRVVIVTLAAAAVASLWVDTSGVPRPAVVWLPPIEWPAFLSALAVAVAGWGLGRLLRLPSPAFLGAMLLGMLVHLVGDVTFQLPPWLMAASYFALGWTIGLNFDRAVVMHAARATPQILASILVLMAFCGGIAWLLAHGLGVDPLTAYLATSPGGMDAVAVIAAASHDVDLSLVMALQSARFLFVLLVGPALARMVARSLRA